MDSLLSEQTLAPIAERGENILVIIASNYNQRWSSSVLVIFIALIFALICTVLSAPHTAAMLSIDDCVSMTDELLEAHGIEL